MHILQIIFSITVLKLSNLFLVKSESGLKTKREGELETVEIALFNNFRKCFTLFIDSVPPKSSPINNWPIIY